MKIRELFETETPLRYNECKFGYTINCEKLITNSDRLNAVAPQAMWEKLAKETDPRLSLAWLMLKSAHFEIIPTEAEYGNAKWFEKLEGDLIEGAKELVKKTLWTVDLKRSYGKLDCFGIPKSVIDCHDITLSLNEQNTTLTGLNKLIGPSCKVLGIANIEYVKSNALSLLKLPKTCDVDFELKEPWAKIIDAHMIGDRNIIACQEELMKNGFKEYAKL